MQKRQRNIWWAGLANLWIVQGPDIKPPYITVLPCHPTCILNSFNQTLDGLTPFPKSKLQPKNRRVGSIPKRRREPTQPTHPTTKHTVSEIDRERNWNTKERVIKLWICSVWLHFFIVFGLQIINDDKKGTVMHGVINKTYMKKFKPLI
jgi:hypothetical protein